jgi:plastocyanin
MKLKDMVSHCSIASGLLLLAASASLQAAFAQLWNAEVGAQSPNKALQALAFLPNELWIHSGDSITWKIAGDEIHTLSLLTPGQVRPPFPVGCPGATQSGGAYDGSSCVNSGVIGSGQAFSVKFTKAGNYKVVCLIHTAMNGVVHVLDASAKLPLSQADYDRLARRERREILADANRLIAHAETVTPRNSVALTGSLVATGGGTQSLAVVRFLDATIRVRVGDTVEWTNLDPVEPHTVTFGTEPGNVLPPSSNVSVDADGALHATLGLPGDSTNSGLIGAAPQDNIGVAQAAPGTTRFRVTFTQPGTFNYICGLHDELGMVGKVVVRP